MAPKKKSRFGHGEAIKEARRLRSTGISLAQVSQDLMRMHGVSQSRACQLKNQIAHEEAEQVTLAKAMQDKKALSAAEMEGKKDLTVIRLMTSSAQRDRLRNTQSRNLLSTPLLKNQMKKKPNI